MSGRKETIELASSPVDEDCAQVGEEDYGVRGRKECRVYRGQLLRILAAAGKMLPETVEIVTKTNRGSDFGDYYELAVRFPEDDETALDLAIWIDDNQPKKWDDTARRELGYAVEVPLVNAEREMLVSALQAYNVPAEFAIFRSKLLAKLTSARTPGAIITEPE